MWDFITNNTAGLNTLANILMLVIWTLYLQLFYLTYRRQRHPKILINRSAGKNLSAQCVVSNMSAEPIYLEAVVIIDCASRETKVYSLTDIDGLRGQPEVDERASWFQGPLLQGQYLVLGHFRDLLQLARHESADSEPDIEAFEVLVIATYGPETSPVGVARVFKHQPLKDRPDNWQALETRWLRSRSERANLKKYLRASG